MPKQKNKNRQAVPLHARILPQPSALTTALSIPGLTNLHKPVRLRPPRPASRPAPRARIQPHAHDRKANRRGLHQPSELVRVMSVRRALSPTARYQLPPFTVQRFGFRVQG